MIGTSTDHDASALVWFKSSYSGGGDGNDCIEIATAPGAVRVRDSKNTEGPQHSKNTEGPQLALSPSAWADFVAYASQR
ncbi:DUF397 domain-containing protein [Streptomyces phaeoluteigriseus]